MASWHKIIIGVIGLGVVAALSLELVRRQSDRQENSAPQTTPSTSAASSPTSTQETFNFSQPKKSAHYESNTPAHGAILAAPPINIVIDFNFDLATGSQISIEGVDKHVGAAQFETSIDQNKLALRRPFDPNAPDGLYTLDYTACWPDKSCHDGQFQFAINRQLAVDFTDRRDQSLVEIDLVNWAFSPQRVRVRAGTTVRWKNTDSVTHYVNTDSHPAHTYHLAQNSKALGKNDTFEVTFDNPGIYPYHCSAHAGLMTGEISVEK